MSDIKQFKYAEIVWVKAQYVTTDHGMTAHPIQVIMANGVEKVMCMDINVKRQSELQETGWRWCKDELPPKYGVFVVLNAIGGNDTATYYPDTQSWNKDGIVQWCKLPEPLKELNVSGLKGEHEDLNGTYPLKEKSEYDKQWFETFHNYEEIYQKFKERMEAER